MRLADATEEMDGAESRDYRERRRQDVYRSPFSVTASATGASTGYSGSVHDGEQESLLGNSCRAARLNAGQVLLPMTLTFSPGAMADWLLTVAPLAKNTRASRVCRDQRRSGNRHAVRIAVGLLMA